MEFLQKITSFVLAGLTGWIFGGANPAVLSEMTISPAPVRENFVWFLVNDTDRLTLIPNYDTRQDFRRLVVDNGCKKAINGGFYDTNSKPLGLVVSATKKTSELRPNALFNGFISVDVDGLGGISRSVDPNLVRDGVQTGPMLVESGRAVSLNLKNDSASRRSVAIFTDDDQLLFGMFYDPDSPLDGPRLSELPELVLKQADKMDVGIVTAINLDGGSASAFYDGGFAVSEWAPVGSVWCLR